VRANGKKILGTSRTKKALDDGLEKEINAFLDVFTKSYVGTTAKAA
jgi:hypothetical protein